MLYRIMSVFVFITLLFIEETFAQTFVKSDAEIEVTTEYHDGRLWVYRRIGDIVVGMTNYKAKDDYGKYYQILIYIANLGTKKVLFEPYKVSSTLMKKQGDTINLKVYTYERFMRKVRRTQNWTMALTAFSEGVNAGNAGYSTSYSTAYRSNGMPYTSITTHYNPSAATAARMAADNNIRLLGYKMSNDRQVIQNGYLKTNTIRPNTSVVGYMNIKRKRGTTMCVNIPVDGKIFSFNWDVGKK